MSEPEVSPEPICSDILCTEDCETLWLPRKSMTRNQARLEALGYLDGINYIETRARQVWMRPATPEEKQGFEFPEGEYGHECGKDHPQAEPWWRIDVV